MRVMSFDLETSGLNADFGVILCACFKWYGDGKKQVKTFRLDEMKSYQSEPWNDAELAELIRDELEQADIIVSYNGKRFDVPFLNARLLYHGKRTMNKIKHIDLLYQARYKLKLHSSRLASIQAFLDLPDSKTEIRPIYWIKALTGHKKSFDQIVHHCKLDVLVLDEAYERLKHFVTVIHP